MSSVWRSFLLTIERLDTNANAYSPILTQTCSTSQAAELMFALLKCRVGIRTGIIRAFLIIMSITINSNNNNDHHHQSTVHNCLRYAMSRPNNKRADLD